MEVGSEWVAAVLKRSPLTRGLPIEVRAVEGGVALEGKVPSLQDRQVAGSVALGALPKGATLLNLLQVSPSTALPRDILDTSAIVVEGRSQSSERRRHSRHVAWFA